jgi:thiamine-phosphate pyrophosphorylase
LLLYYITDRLQFPGNEEARRRRLLETIAQAARYGVDFIQLRERDLSAASLEELAREAVAVLNELRAENKKPKTALLINSRTDVAIACGADGVHLRSNDLSPVEVRKIWTQCAGALACVTVGISCHTPSEVADAAAQGADFAVFGPVFEKKDLPENHPTSLADLRLACRKKIPVLALGGVTVENAGACLQAGAAGVAGIRLFQENEIGTVVERLRGLGQR